MRVVFLALLLVGCSNDDGPTVVGHSITPPPAGAGWTITQASQPRQISSANFDFPVCASAQTCWISYVELPYTTALHGLATLNWAITGSSPKFINDRVGNSCGGPEALSLFFHMAGDTGVLQYGRWFSHSKYQVPLALGSFELKVPISLPEWIDVYGQSTNAAGFAQATEHPGSIGFVLGGGCFAGHGVAIRQGSAKFQINGMMVQ